MRAPRISVVVVSPSTEVEINFTEYELACCPRDDGMRNKEEGLQVATREELGDFSP